jgi:hypothetical protein
MMQRRDCQHANKALSDLDLSHYYIRSYGVTAITLSLRQNNTLARLNLKNDKHYDGVGVDIMFLPNGMTSFYI